MRGFVVVLSGFLAAACKEPPSTGPATSNAVASGGGPTASARNPGRRLTWRSADRAYSHTTTG
jgi:hypothetical protein